MGRRSRKRATAPDLRAPSPAPAADPARPRRRARTGEAPEAPWAPFPLVELAILLGLVFVVAGLVWGGSQGRTLLGCGIVVVGLASLEVAVREHVTGFRSHSTLLALVPTAIAVAISWFAADVIAAVRLGIAATVFIISFLALREVFRRRSGGLSFRA
jgi:hypothetical protein